MGYQELELSAMLGQLEEGHATLLNNLIGFSHEPYEAVAEESRLAEEETN